jgi:purine catabolism regulator
MELSCASVADRSGAAAAHAHAPAGEPRLSSVAEQPRCPEAELQDLRRAVSIREELSRLALGGSGFGRVAAVLAQSVGNPVLIENRFFRSLGYAASHGPTTRDDRPVSTGVLLRDVRGQALATRLHDDRQPVVVAPRPGRGIAQARLVAPVVIADDVVGYVSILERDRPLEHADVLVAGHAAQAVAIEFARQQAALEAEVKLTGSLLDTLLHGGDVSAEIRGARGSLLSYDTSASQMLLIAEPDPTTDRHHLVPPRYLVTLVTPWARRVASGSLVTEKAGQVVVLLAGDVMKPRTRPTRVSARTNGQALSPGLLTRGADVELAESLRQEIGSIAPDLAVSIAIAPPVRDVRELGRAYDSARRALAVLRQLGETGGVVSTTDPRLAVFFLFDTTRPEKRQEFVDLVLGPLMAYDQEHCRSLLATLQAYLACAGNLETTARMLNVHTSTLKYRLQRIAEVGGLDVRNADHRFNAALALRLRALAGDHA